MACLTRVKRDVTREPVVKPLDSPSAATTLGQFPVLGELQERHSRQGPQHVAGGLVDAQVTAQIAGIVINDLDRLSLGVEFEPPRRDPPLQGGHGMLATQASGRELQGIELSEGPMATGAGAYDVVDPPGLEEGQVLSGGGLEGSHVAGQYAR